MSYPLLVLAAWVGLLLLLLFLVRFLPGRRAAPLDEHAEADKWPRM